MMSAFIDRLRIAATSALFATGVLLAGMTGQVEAQQRVGDDGRALDANQQVGGGGTNPQRDQVDYRLRNDVVTGNVGGGRSFRGDVGYQAPGEFEGTTGADDLFQFRRDAAGSGDVGGGVTDRGSVYRPYASPHAVRPRLGPNQAQTSWSIDGQQPLRGDVDLRIRPGRQQLDAFDRVSLDGEGNWLDVSASPLLGVRSDVRLGQGVPGVDGVDPLREAPLLPDMEDPLQWREEDWQIDRSLRRSSLLDGRAYQLSTDVGTRDEDLLRTPGMRPTRMLGDQLRSQVLDPDRDPQRAEAAEQRMAQLEEQVFRPLQGVQSVEPGEDVYMDLLAAMRDPERDMDDDSPWENRLVRPRDDEQDEDQREADDPFALPDALRRDAQDDEQQADREQSRAQALLDRLDHDFEPLDSLAGDGEGQTNRLLREAEQLLGEGRFFDAEAAYREVVVREGDAPMARVGLTHAQLSAGMIRSASTNLRTLFEQHPELIATRYEANLLPPADRLEWIAGELRRLMDDERRAPGEAALLLAYLGYQQGDEQMIREGLDAVQAREDDEHDGLLHVLQHIWLDEPGPDEDAAK